MKVDKSSGQKFDKLSTSIIGPEHRFMGYVYGPESGQVIMQCNTMTIMGTGASIYAHILLTIMCTKIFQFML